jgi:hypothetical protein
VDFDSWDFGMVGDDRESQTLEEEEIHMDPDNSLWSKLCGDFSPILNTKH